MLKLFPKKWIALVLAVLMLMPFSTTLAQTDTTTEPTSTVNFFFVLCETQAVIDFSGNVQSGYDIYFQIFSGPRGGGTALTSLRRLGVSGEYRRTEVVPFNTGATVATGTIGSMYIAIARIGNTSSTLYADYVDDIQDGCREGVAQLPPGTSTTTSTSTSTSTTTTATVSYPSIRSPFGGFINPGYRPPAPTPVVQIGASVPVTKPRQQTAGMIFAECNQYPMAEPGILYDTDNIVIFWSWYARTEALALDHINTVTYAIAAWGNPFSNVVRTEVQLLGGDYWVFYYIPVGNLRPGHYQVEYKAFWSEPISDGYETFGPGTPTPELTGDCYFEILPNPSGTPVNYVQYPR